MKAYKNFYFWAMLAVEGEAITTATRFKYFLTHLWRKATEGNAIKRQAHEKIQHIAQLLAKRDEIPYNVVRTDSLSNAEYTVLKKRFPHYDHHGDILVPYDTSDETDDEGAKPSRKLKKNSYHFIPYEKQKRT